MLQEKRNILIVVLIFLYLVDGAVQVQQIYGELNGNVTLRPDIKGDIEDILWKHNGDKVVECENRKKIRSYRGFVGRVILNTTTGHLTIEKLTTEDSGRYTAEPQIGGKLQDFGFNLTVIAPVTTPTVRCEGNETTGTLFCSAEGPYIKFRWDGPNIATPPWSDVPEGLVIMKEQNLDTFYACVVKNQVSERSSDPFKTADCFPGSSSSIGGIIGAISVVLLLLVVMITIIYFHCKKGIRQIMCCLQQDPSKNNKDMEKTELLTSARKSNENEETRETISKKKQAFLESEMIDRNGIARGKAKCEEEEVRGTRQEEKGAVEGESQCDVEVDEKESQTDEKKEGFLDGGIKRGNLKLQRDDVTQKERHGGVMEEEKDKELKVKQDVTQEEKQGGLKQEEKCGDVQQEHTMPLTCDVTLEEKSGDLIPEEKPADVVQEGKLVDETQEHQNQNGKPVDETQEHQNQNGKPVDETQEHQNQNGKPVDETQEGKWRCE